MNSANLNSAIYLFYITDDPMFAYSLSHLFILLNNRDQLISVLFDLFFICLTISSITITNHTYDIISGSSKVWFVNIYRASIGCSMNVTTKQHQKKSMPSVICGPRSWFCMGIIILPKKCAMMLAKRMVIIIFRVGKKNTQ